MHGHHDSLADDFRRSLVAIPAAAFTIEALYEDTRFLVPPVPERGGIAKTVVRGLSLAFGIEDERTKQGLFVDVGWLFESRHRAAHPYSEPEAPKPHPAGVNASTEASVFNGFEATRAVDLAVRLLAFAAQPPTPSRWVARWVEERHDHHARVVAPLLKRRDRALSQLGDPGGLPSG